MRVDTVEPLEARCAHCHQPRVVFPAKFVDWTDAFDNGTDEQLAAAFGGTP